MILRSVGIWIAICVIWLFLMSPVTSLENAHEERLADIEKEITEVKIEIKRKQNQKSMLLKQRDDLSKQIENQIKIGEESKRLLQNN